MKVYTLDEYNKHLGIGENGRSGAANPRIILELPEAATNDLVSTTMLETIEKSKSARLVDIVIRRDGVETRFQADWIKYLVVVEGADQ